jgi:hypothetical protein
LSKCSRSQSVAVKDSNSKVQDIADSERNLDQIKSNPRLNESDVDPGVDPSLDSGPRIDIHQEDNENRLDS